MKTLRHFAWMIILAGISFTGLEATGQSTVFSIMQDPLKQADKSYTDGNYLEAIEQYRKLSEKRPADQHVQLRLAQSHYRVKQYDKAVMVYDLFLKRKSALPAEDMYFYAEAQSSLKNYTTALSYYKQCLERDPENDLIAKKIWRLNNLQYLYEDSAHYAVRFMSVNTTLGELCPVPYKNSVVFTSNRKEAKLTEKVNGKLNTPFYQLYAVEWQLDSTTQAKTFLKKPVGFAKTVKSRYNTGPVAFYNKGDQMVYVSSSEKKEEEGSYTLGLYFASQQNKKWKVDASFPFNNDNYSIHDVAITEDGTRLYFSSDMKGGMGGKDIYTSERVDGQWSKPKNLGEPINTDKNEVFPYVHSDGSLYFSSDGHAGLGELDIFKSQIRSEGYSEPQNVGYPLNSSFDDFGLSFDSLATHGYFASNRKNGGYDDDLYEFDMDLQTYPFTITGVLKYKEHTWSDPSAIHTWPRVSVVLVDSWLGTGVHRSVTDGEGNFSIVIPYFSKYYIEVIDEEGHHHKASLEIQKHKTETNVHEIVVIKDIFNPNTGK